MSLVPAAPQQPRVKKRRCKRAIEYGANVFDSRFLSHSYTLRLEKYGKRGADQNVRRLSIAPRQHEMQRSRSRVEVSTKPARLFEASPLECLDLMGWR